MRGGVCGFAAATAATSLLLCRIPQREQSRENRGATHHIVHLFIQVEMLCQHGLRDIILPLNAIRIYGSILRIAHLDGDKYESKLSVP